jgi:hypothetical protein
MSEPPMVASLKREGLVPGLTEVEVRTLADLSEQELNVLKSIKSRLDDAIGVDSVHRPEDGGLFW